MKRVDQERLPPGSRLAEMRLVRTIHWAKKAGRVRGGAVLAKPEKWIEINSTNY